jgi:CheY-like chemotaxis protein
MLRKVCLLVEDDRDDQELFNTTLQKISPGTLLVTAPDAESAKKLLRDEKLPDFIILDLYLPGIDGYEFLLQLKRDLQHRRIPVIIYSQVCDENEIQKLKKFGAMNVLSKSTDQEKLENLLSKLV